jgi:hypothetical protein
MVAIANKLANMDKRILFALMFLTMAVPLVKPFTLPLVIEPEVKALYDFIEKLGPSDTVIMMADHSPAYKPTVHGALEAIFKQLTVRGCKVVFMSFSPDGPMLVEQAISSGEFLASKKYGVDYVNLGYRAGGEGAVAAVFQDMAKNFPADFRGTPVAQLPIMANIKSAKDISLCVLFSTGGYAGGGLVRQLVQPFNKPLACVVTGMMGPAHYPYWQAKQLVGLVIDMSGGAEYETLVARPGLSLAGMGAQTMTQLLMILFMGFANVAYFLNKREQKGHTKGGA